MQLFDHEVLMYRNDNKYEHRTMLREIVRRLAQLP